MSGFYLGGEEIRKWVRDIETRYSNVFMELGPGTAYDFKRLIDNVDACLDLLMDEKTDFRVKLMDYSKTKSDVNKFCNYYEKWLGPLAKRLEAEVFEVLDEAIIWWG